MASRSWVEIDVFTLVQSEALVVIGGSLLDQDGALESQDHTKSYRPSMERPRRTYRVP